VTERSAPAGDGPSRPAGDGRRGRPWSGGGREELAAAIRRLTELCVTADASPAALGEAARRATALADELEVSVPDPDPVPTGRFADGRAQPGPEGASSLAAAMPFDMVIGTCNPVAPPLTLSFDPPLARGRAVFGPPFEGAPGCVHGAALAAAFDIVLTAANVLAGAAGPTVELRLRYLKPTLANRPSDFEASVVSTEGRRTHTTGRLIQGDVVTVEAHGEFVNLPPHRLDMLHRMAASRRAEGDGGS
jgi:acyl-coenzyme A thioesterase PaaI-like protein